MIQALLFGLALGALGLLPFFHPNLLLKWSEITGGPFNQVLFAAAVASSHAVFSSAASAILLLPNAQTGFLPLSKADSIKQAKVIAKTAVYSIIASVAFTPVAIIFFPLVMPAIVPFTGWLLATLVIIFLANEERPKLVAGIIAFTASGLVGFISLNSGMVVDPLYSLLTGFFAIPLLVASLLGFGEESEATEPDLKSSALAAVTGAASGFLPALTPTVLAGAASLASNKKTILTTVTATLFSKNYFDLINAFIIGKARSGPAAAIFERISQVPLEPMAQLVCVAAAAIFSTAIACLVVLKAANFFANGQLKLSKNWILALVVFAFASNAFFNGHNGLVVACCAGIIGTLVLRHGLRLSYCTGSLLLPTLAYYTGVTQLVQKALIGG